MRSVLCMLGLHKYKIAKSVGTLRDEESQTGSTRECERCGVKETLYVHCLGLNPPAYSYTWLENEEGE